ncbi:isocitrate lyase/PEP mutase family protein [Crocosphaera sp. XPORK-15E]|uniref:isocitrate lyase/PEP mutase family protein n=1 Tax=Crocosphaera sp. XPORK-15E TaxID=3110247 RepID=UPI002B1FC360|nr:isocitrate lyase/PEP mutase family protein [Crocosphaera sp. XPORK-15E]MEA5534435.1 isocitrate lyase/PEP mutase family protein [Crocosphaera sp. XPORK-15E]
MTAPNKLRQLLDEPGILAAPAVYDCIGSKLAEKAGFPLIFTSGFGISASLLGLPDMGFLTATEMLNQVKNIIKSVNIPVICDLDTGYGNVLNVRRTIEDVVQFGAAGIILEDQEWPKKCGHFEGKKVIPTDEMVKKIKAAVDARNNSNLVIIGRTDARAIYGLDEALNRGKQYQEAGADIIFIEAPQSVEELEKIVTYFPDIPLFANIIEGGKTPCLTVNELEKMGFKLVAFALSGLLSGTNAVSHYFEQLKQTGTVNQNNDFCQFQDFKNLIEVDKYRELEMSNI